MRYAQNCPLSQLLTFTLPSRVQKPMRSFSITSKLATGLVFALLLSLAACDSAGTGEEEPDTTSPSAPSGLSATSGDGEMSLSWNSASASDLAGYHLYRAERSISSVDGMTPVSGSAPISETSLTDSDVENGTTYYYRVAAVDEDGNESTLSGEVKGTPFPNPPDRP